MIDDHLERLKATLADRYTIERELGQGGMATVYLAEDLKHHRRVALKILRPEIAATLGSGRFAREIEVAARLQHPNILPLLDSGETDGFFFYVMPYVEGESVRDRLVRSGEFAIPEAVRILIEVADALSHAHAHGVVHRDIKPDNILLSGRHALVADFGVAKAVTQATGYQALTSAGIALGTPAYMAPEQAVADPHQDHRVDIYALGVLGYELLAGRAPFDATTAQEMLAAHVTTDPAPLQQYRPTAAPALAAVVMKCLAKKPADRWQTAEEVLQHLEPLATPSGGTTPTQTAPVEAVRSRRRALGAAVGAGAIVLVAAGVILYQALRAKPLTIRASDIIQLTKAPGVEYQPAISPDGNEVAYVAGPINWPRLFVRSTVNIAGGAVRLGEMVAGSEWFPSWSADGQSVRFYGCRGDSPFFMFADFEGAPWEARCAWQGIGKLGGAIQPETTPLPPWPWALSRDGTRMAFVHVDTLFTALADGSAMHRLAVHPSGRALLHSPVFSPDGERIAYVEGNAWWLTSSNVANTRIWVVDADAGPPHPVTALDHQYESPVWLDAHHLLFVSDRDGAPAVYAVEVGPRGARGARHPISGLADIHSISYSSSARRLAYARVSLRQNIWSYPLGHAAPISIRDGQAVTTGSQVIETLAVSPDGGTIAYSAYVHGHMTLHKLPSSGGQPVPLTPGAAAGQMPCWSPDGREIAYMGAYTATPDSAAASQIMVVPAEGGRSVAATSGPGLKLWCSWAPDGLTILYRSPDSLGGLGLWGVSRDRLRGPWHAAEWWWNTIGTPASPDGGGWLLVRGSTLELRGRDGRVTWQRDLAATSRLTVGKGSRRLAPNGRTIYLSGTRDGRRGIWAVPVRGGEPRLVVAFDDPALTTVGTWAVGPDRLYIVVSEYESDIWAAKLNY